MVKLVLSFQLLSQVETACKIDSLSEYGMAELKINTLCEKQVLVFY